MNKLLKNTFVVGLCVKSAVAVEHIIHLWYNRLHVATSSIYIFVNLSYMKRCGTFGLITFNVSVQFGPQVTFLGCNLIYLLFQLHTCLRFVDAASDVLFFVTV